ncbi:MAG: HK97 gp10 family phage protein [Rhodoglobus sp.]
MRFNNNFIPTLANSPEVENLVRNKADEVATTARTTAPVETGDYRDSIRVTIEHTPFRVLAKVVAESKHSMLVESKHGTLARALRTIDRG